MDSWNTIVSRCFSFSLGYVSFLEGGEWWGTFFGGATEDQEWNFWEPTYVPFQQSWHKWIMVSLTMTVVSCRKSALSFSKPRSSGGFSVESYPSMSSQFFCIRIFVLLDTTLFFFHVLLSTGPSTYKEPTGLQSRPTNRGKKRSGAVLPSFPTLNAGALCDFLHLLGLTLQGVGFSLRSFFLGRQEEVISQTLNEFVVCCGWFVELTPLVCELSLVFFWFYHL